MNRKATGVMDQWLTLGELAELFGLSEEFMKRVVKITFSPAAADT